MTSGLNFSRCWCQNSNVTGSKERLTFSRLQLGAGSAELPVLTRIWAEDPVRLRTARLLKVVLVLLLDQGSAGKERAGRISIDVFSFNNDFTVKCKQSVEGRSSWTSMEEFCLTLRWLCRTVSSFLQRVFPAGCSKAAPLLSNLLQSEV